MGKKDENTEPESVESGGPRPRAVLPYICKSHPEILDKTEMSKPLLKHCCHDSVENHGKGAGTSQCETVKLANGSYLAIKTVRKVTWKMALSVKCLLCKPEDLNPTPRGRIKIQTYLVISTSVQRQSDLGPLASQPDLISKSLLAMRHPFLKHMADGT